MFLPPNVNLKKAYKGKPHKNQWKIYASQRIETLSHYVIITFIAHLLSSNMPSMWYFFWFALVIIVTIINLLLRHTFVEIHATLNSLPNSNLTNCTIPSVHIWAKMFYPSPTKDLNIATIKRDLNSQLYKDTPNMTATNQPKRRRQRRRRKVR